MIDPQNPANPSDVNVGALADQLTGARVAFGTNAPANAQLGEALDRAIGEEGPRGLGEVHMVVLEQTPPHVPQLRDIAQDVALQSGADTVVVRTPHAAVGVSDMLTRAQIERGQRAMVAEPDYADGVHAFAQAATGFTIPWGAALALGLTLLACIVIATARGVRRDKQ